MTKERKGRVKSEEMTDAKQLERALEYFPEVTLKTLQDYRMAASPETKRYILYGIR